MQPTRQTLSQPISIAGISARTTNAAESNPATAQIAGLWGRFFSEGWLDPLPSKVPDKRPGSAIYGVYSGYESDYKGAFDVTAGVATSNPEGPLALQVGNYLVFSATGPMPQTVVQTWGAVWQYFQGNPGIERSYSTDFEAYVGADAVEIHIGVKA